LTASIKKGLRSKVATDDQDGRLPGRRLLRRAVEAAQAIARMTAVSCQAPRTTVFLLRVEASRWAAFVAGFSDNDRCDLPDSSVPGVYWTVHLLQSRLPLVFPFDQ
jgi:hypothetical protein